MKKYLFTFLLLVSLAAAQVPFEAALPTDYVDNSQCNPPGGVYEVDVTLASPALTVAGIQNAVNQWDGTKWYRLKIPPGIYSCTTFNADGACVSMPQRSGVNKCLAVESTTPNPAGQMVCSHGLPGFGGTRNPGCDGHTLPGLPNDVANMWTLRMDNTGTGQDGIAILGGFGTSPANHIVIRDLHCTIKPGTSQNGTGPSSRRCVRVDGDQVSSPFVIGVERSYFNGNDPGDPGQPGAGSGNPAVDNTTGACLAWNMTGTVTTSSTGNTVTWASGNSFGMTFVAGKPITINGVVYTIATVDPNTNDTSLTLTTDPGNQSTPVAYTYQNAPPQYANGCGDDMAAGAVMNADNSWFMWNYVEKIHSAGAETHATSFGFSNGPLKFNSNWIEGGSAGVFSGGAPVDSAGGPLRNLEFRKNFVGVDLAWRQLACNAGHSPAPPFGCGPIAANHHNSPFNWARKNALELKLCIQCVLDGNIFDGNWADGQDGTLVVNSVRVISGGQNAGIFDPVTGLPATGVQDIRYTNNWFRNSNQGPGMATRSGQIGSGGGTSLPIIRVDWQNNAFSNIGDLSQFGGDAGNDLITWGSGQNYYQCAMSRDLVNHKAIATCQTGLTSTEPGSEGDSAKSVVRSGCPGACVVTVALAQGHRHDPQIGGTVTVAGKPGWNGTFTITGVSNSGSTAPCTGNNATTPQPCIRSDGTFGDTFTYSDSQGGNATLCSSTVLCDKSGALFVYQTLGYKMTDIEQGDAVHTVDYGNILTAAVGTAGSGYVVGDSLFISQTSSDFGLVNVSTIDGSGGVTAFTIANAGRGYHVANNVGTSGGTGTGFKINITAIDTSCSTNGYAVGDVSLTAAVSPTDPRGLVVYWADSTASSPAATCLLDNGSGFPKKVTFINNVVANVAAPALASPGTKWQHILNTITGNIFAATGASNADIACNATTEGNAALNGCWDTSTLIEGGNILQGRSSGNWTPSFGGAAANQFPASATCSGSPASTCLGWNGYTAVGGVGKTFPTSVCPDGNAPYNCPLMALPWADNLRLTDLVLLPGSSWFGSGPDTAQLIAAFTLDQYVCPVGANCGTHGPYPDGGVSPTPPGTLHLLKGNLNRKGNITTH